MWAIVLPAIALPIYFALAYNLRKAEKKGIMEKKSIRWDLSPKSIWWAIIEFDSK